MKQARARSFHDVGHGVAGPVALAYTEAELAAAWAEGRYDRGGLVDSLGRPLRVIFPGRRWGGPGPDFQGALVALPNSSLLRGDVEIHRRASAWVRHGHAVDPAYGSVVLHVVQVADADTRDITGRLVPTVVLQPRPTPAWRPAPACLQDPAAVEAVVLEAGRTRFRAKAARFEADLAAIEPDQVLWRGLAEALGYSRNTWEFGRLADAVPWVDLAAIARERGIVGATALLLGTAGLIDEASPEEVEAWEDLRVRTGARGFLAADSWARSQVRPGNSPAQRCRGLARLARACASDSVPPRQAAEGRYPEGGIRRESHPPDSGALTDLALATVREEASRPRAALWRFALATPWIGRGRAQSIAINVLLPFAAASGLEEAVSLYERLPGEPTNRPVAYMASLLPSATRAPSACYQQGLLQLFKDTCAAHACERCPAAARPVPPIALASNGA